MALQERRDESGDVVGEQGRAVVAARLDGDVLVLGGTRVIEGLRVARVLLVVAGGDEQHGYGQRAYRPVRVGALEVLRRRDAHHAGHRGLYPRGGVENGRTTQRRADQEQPPDTLLPYRVGDDAD